MRLALAEARLGLEAGELPVGAVVVLRGEVIASAHTSEQREGRLLVHADLLALQAADKLKLSTAERREAKLFVTGEPCLMCLGAAMSFFIGEVYFGHESPTDGAVSLVNSWTRPAGFTHYQTPKITGGILRSEAILLFREYVAMHPPSPLSSWAESIAHLQTH
jgi:tRNA(adenine34) deaminase